MGASAPIILFGYLPIIDIFTVGIPNHPESNDDHWEAENLSFGHPAE